MSSSYRNACRFLLLSVIFNPLSSTRYRYLHSLHLHVLQVYFRISFSTSFSYRIACILTILTAFHFCYFFCFKFHYHSVVVITKACGHKMLNSAFIFLLHIRFSSISMTSQLQRRQRTANVVKLFTTPSHLTVCNRKLIISASRECHPALHLLNCCWSNHEQSSRVGVCKYCSYESESVLKQRNSW